MTFAAGLKTIAAATVLSLACFGIGTLGLNSGTAVAPAQARQSEPATAASTVAAAGITLNSVNVELPVSDGTFPGGADAGAINDNCLTCHSTGMVLTQPPLSRSLWQQEVEKMRTQYKAPVEASEVPAIVAYLASHDGAR